MRGGNEEKEREWMNACVVLHLQRNLNETALEVAR